MCIGCCYGNGEVRKSRGADEKAGLRSLDRQGLYSFKTRDANPSTAANSDQCVFNIVFAFMAELWYIKMKQAISSM